MQIGDADTRRWSLQRNEVLADVRVAFDGSPALYFGTRNYTSKNCPRSTVGAAGSGGVTGRIETSGASVNVRAGAGTTFAVVGTVDDGESVVSDGAGQYVDHDVKEVLAPFMADAVHRRISVTIVGIDMSPAQAGGGH